jgi:hypothetical protein
MSKNLGNTIWVVSAGLLLATSATANDSDALPLKGLKTFRIVIEDLPPEAAKCGIYKVGVETSLRFILGQSRMKITSQGLTMSGIYARINALPNCAMSVSLQVLADVVITQNNQKDDAATIWDQEILSTGPNSGQAAQENIEQLAKQLVNDWNSVN